MIVQTIKVNDCAPQTIVIGRRGTYDTMQIAFDLSYLVESYGDGVAVLAVKRSQDESAYPAVTSQEDDLLLWTVSETDTYYVGAGEAQLMWYVDGGLAKTIIYPMVVMKDILATSEEAPDAYQTWVDDLTALGAETLQNAQDAAQSASDAEDAKDDAVAAKEAAEAALEEFTTPTASATTLSAGSQATATYNDGNFAFGIPRGADGSPGTPGAPGADGVTPDFSIGTVTTLEPTQPATATITGTAEAPVLNLGIPKGAKGDPGQSSGSVDSVNGQTGAVILDAGDLEFDDTETYAAGSVGAELSNQKNAISQLDGSLTSALTELLAHVAFADEHGQDYYDMLLASLHGDVTVSSISAVFNQGTAEIYDTDTLDTLRQYLTLTATYSDGTSKTVIGYALSGTLEAGTSVITAHYGGKSATFNVTVTVFGAPIYYLPSEFTSDGTNSIDTGVNLEAGTVYTFVCDLTLTTATGGNNVRLAFGNRVADGSSYLSLQEQAGNFWGFGVTYGNRISLGTKRARVVTIVTVNSNGSSSCSMNFKNVTDDTAVVTKSNTYVAGCAITEADYYLGSYPASNNGIRGVIHDFKIYDYALDASAIADYLANG